MRVQGLENVCSTVHGYGLPDGRIALAEIEMKRAIKGYRSVILIVSPNQRSAIAVLKKWSKKKIGLRSTDCGPITSTAHLWKIQNY